MQTLTNLSKRNNQIRTYNDNTWSSAVIQTILAGCAKKKRKTDISDDVFAVTPLRRLIWTATVARVCDDPASPTRHEMRNIVIIVINDSRNRCSRQKWNGKLKMIPMQRIRRSMMTSEHMKSSR